MAKRETIHIRPFVPGDQTAARTLILNGLGEHFGFIDDSLNPDLNHIQEHYVTSGNTFVVAELEGVLVGTGALVEEEVGTGRIVRMSVNREYRRLGIGRALVEHLVQTGCERRYRQILVETNLDWDDAIGLYQHCGFIEYDRDEESIYMVRRLA